MPGDILREYAKCSNPKCDALISGMVVRRMTSGEVAIDRHGEWQTITLECPYCGIVLGAQIDPRAFEVK